MTSVSYHNTVNDLQPSSCAWRDAAFASRAWYALLEKHGHRPLVALAGDGRDFAALVLEAGPRGLQSLSNWYGFTWRPNYIADHSREPAIALARDLRRRHARIDLAKLPAESGEVAFLANCFRLGGWQVFVEECDVNHVLLTAGRSYHEYLASRPGPLRTTLRRKSAKLDVSVSRRFDGALWETYAGIYAQSWKPAEGNAAFLRDFARQESDAGRFLFGLARAEGQPVAAQFWTLQDGTAYIHKLAHLPDAERLSPGTVLTCALMEYAIDEAKVGLVDFGTGDDAYKRDWMEEVRTRLRITCLDPQRPANWPAIARHALRGLVSPARAG